MRLLVTDRAISPDAVRPVAHIADLIGRGEFVLKDTCHFKETEDQHDDGKVKDHHFPNPGSIGLEIDIDQYRTTGYFKEQERALADNINDKIENKINEK
jgi:hypothetical protein